MCQPEVYWLLKQSMLLFSGWQIWISKEMSVKKKYRYMRMVPVSPYGEFIPNDLTSWVDSCLTWYLLCSGGCNIFIFKTYWLFKYCIEIGDRIKIFLETWNQTEIIETNNIQDWSDFVSFYYETWCFICSIHQLLIHLLLLRGYSDTCSWDIALVTIAVVKRLKFEWLS